MIKTIITGGSGFIGTNLVEYLLNKKDFIILNIDKLGYASNQNSFERERLSFIKLDIQNQKKLSEVIIKFKPQLIFNLAAETHVDRSISHPYSFIKSNILGTYSLLESIRHSNIDCKLIHISTDEVFGDLENSKRKFKENSPYNPSSPYSASKASSDFLVKSWGRTFDIKYNVTNCSNNFGPYQNKEKLIPKVIDSIINKKPIPVYGKGNQIRDWLYVEDHCSALYQVFKKFKNKETYNIGSNNQIRNINLIKQICYLTDKEIYKRTKRVLNSTNLISNVNDRPGHDIKYAINNEKIENSINWKPKFKMKQALQITIKWYLDKLL